MSKLIDLTGQRFGRLTVIKRAGSDNQNQATWLCECECGNYTSVGSSDLRRGKTTSCGCYHNECAKIRMTTHGMAHTKLYWIWKSMNQRCYNKRSKDFPNYGGMGIEVCQEWRKDFKAFSDWAYSAGYMEGLSIDRIKGDENYSPNNCRWATAKVQANNIRRNHILTYNGLSHTMSEWSDITGIKYSTLRARINTYKWSVERALTTPGGNK